MGKPSSEKLVSSINESAQQVGAATLTFLVVCVYIGIAVASTEDEVLLLGTNIGLPLFDVQIPLDKFYFLAPALLTFLHLHLLLLQFLLVSKVVKFCQEDNPPEEETDLFFPSLPISILLGQKHPGMVRFLLWLLLFTITIVLPVGLLIATQVKFLPHHSASITAWHKSLVLFDIALIWYFRLRLPTLPDPEEPVTPPQGFESHIWSYSSGSTPRPQSAPRSWKNPLETQILKSLGWLGAGALTVGAIIFSTLFAGGSEIGGKLFRARSNLLARAFSENLSLVESRLIDGELPEGKEPSPDHPRGVRLTERDLKEGDFTRAVLVNADLRGADLTGANFENADLRFAKLSPAKGMDGVLERLEKELTPETIDRARKRVLIYRTRLQDSRLRGADLRNANLFMADLRSADLGGAKLDGADLRLADLRGAYLRGASLRGALLSGSILNLADLSETNLLGADLARASLLGADLWRSKMAAAYLGESDLRGAKLVEVEAVLADFSAATVDGADFQNAWLNGAVGLALHGIDLRGAHLAAANLCMTGNPNGDDITFRASDLRFIDIQDPPTGWGVIWADLEKLLPKEESSQITLPKSLLRVKDWYKDAPTLYGPPCLVKPGEDPRRLLYYELEIPGYEKWPDSAATEQAYHRELASILVEQACDHHDLTQVLLRELSGESVPRRRLLAIAIANRMKGSYKKSCKAFQLLSKEQRQLIERTASEDPLKTDE